MQTSETSVRANLLEPLDQLPVEQQESQRRASRIVLDVPLRVDWTQLANEHLPIAAAVLDQLIQFSDEVGSHVLVLLSFFRFAGLPPAGLVHSSYFGLAAS